MFYELITAAKLALTGVTNIIPAHTQPVHIQPDARGTASWYGEYFHGRQAADGSYFDMYEMTAAHRDLRFGTKVKVFNPSNGKSVVVKITDRGPYYDEENRIIDLSMAAFESIADPGSGLAEVELFIQKEE